MPTEAFEIAEAASVRIQKKRFDSRYARQICDNVKDALVDAGWILHGATPAIGTVSHPYGAPVITIPEPPPEELEPIHYSNRRFLLLGTMVSGVRIDRWFCAYDPYREDPIGEFFVTWFAIGTSVAGTFANLMTAIALDAPWSPSIHIDTRGSWILTLESLTDGTEYVSYQFGGAAVWSGDPRGFYSVHFQPARGGWILRSYLTEEKWLEVWIYVNDDGMAHFEFRGSEPDGQTPTFALRPTFSSGTTESDKQYWYSIIANKHQFFIYRENGDLLTFPGSQNLLASMPQPYEEVEYAVLIVAHNLLRRNLEWKEESYYACARNGGLSTVQSGNFDGCSPSLYLWESPSYPLLDSQGRPILSSAYVGVPEGPGFSAADHSRVVGLLWDSFLTSTQASLGSHMSLRGRNYQCILSQPGGFGNIPGSLWMALP